MEWDFMGSEWSSFDPASGLADLWEHCRHLQAIRHSMTDPEPQITLWTVEQRGKGIVTIYVQVTKNGSHRLVPLESWLEKHSLTPPQVEAVVKTMGEYTPSVQYQWFPTQ